jgi:D-alanine--poly(phosphoribitol) ligase subunit 2
MQEMKQRAYEVVRRAVAELGEDMGFPSLVKPDESTPLFGGDDGIDSLSLVRLVADIERATEAELGKSVVLADERAMSRRNSPFRTVGTLSELLSERLGAVHE